MTNAKKYIKNNWDLWLLISPMLIWIALFSYKPLWGVIIAFKDYDPYTGISGSPWVFFDNFKTLMFGTQSEYFWRAFFNTIYLSLYGLFLGFPIPIIVAILFHEIRGNNFRKAIQTITYAPHFISDVVICSLVLTMLGLDGGFFNIIFSKVCGAFGIPYTNILFMQNSNFFRGIYTVSGIWKNCGFESIVFFSALCGIPMELYEAARVDGASRFKQIWNISIPGILPTIVIMFIIRIGNILNIGYEKVLLLYNPSIYDKADILSTYTYRLGIGTSPDYGLSTAASLFNSVIGFCLVIAANKIARKFSQTSLW